TEPASNFQRLYKAFGSNLKFRFVGVSTDRQPKPADTTFPLTYNQGSTLFGAAAGEFVLLDETGSVQLRGSLIRDFDSLLRGLQGNYPKASLVLKNQHCYRVSNVPFSKQHCRRISAVSNRDLLENAG